MQLQRRDRSIPYILKELRQFLYVQSANHQSVIYVLFLKIPSRLKEKLVKIYLLSLSAPIHPDRNRPEADPGPPGRVQGRDRRGGDPRHSRGQNGERDR